MNKIKEDIVFSLTIQDFEGILGRDLTQDEISLITDKFSIDNWSVDVECFLDAMDITK